MLIKLIVLPLLESLPVAVTTARPSPSTTVVPAKAVSSIAFLTGLDSPVIELSSQAKLPSTILTSAASTSPRLSEIKSPLTSCLESSLIHLPSRSTDTVSQLV